MSVYTRLLIGIILFGIMGGGLTACSNPDDIVVGAILSLHNANGEERIADQEVLNGMTLAVATLNPKYEHSRRPIRLVVRDCKTDPKLARKYFKELAHLSPVVIVNTFTHITKALSPLAAETKQTQLATLASAEDITKGAPYTFRYWPQASEEAKAILPILIKNNVKKLGVVNLDNEYGHSMADRVMLAADTANIESRKISFSQLNEDLTNKLETLRDSDAVFFVCFTPSVVPLTTLLKKALPNTILIGPNNITNPSIVTNDTMTGVYASSPQVYNKSFPFIREVGDVYEKEYGMPFSHYSAIGYDIIQLISQVAINSTASSDSVKTALESGFVFPGLFGDVLNPAGSHHFTYPLHPSRIMDDGIHYLRR